MLKEKPVHYDLSYKVCGVLFAVHNELGRLRNEKEYADATEKYLKVFNLPYEREKHLPPSFEGESPNRNRIDFIVDDKIILEIKTKRMLERTDYFQVKRYLVAMNKKLGLLVNFRDKYIKPRRILNSLV